MKTYVMWRAGEENLLIAASILKSKFSVNVIGRSLIVIKFEANAATLRKIRAEFPKNRIEICTQFRPIKATRATKRKSS